MMKVQNDLDETKIVLYRGSSQGMKTVLFWIALVALLVQALGYDLEGGFLEQPQEEEDADRTGYPAVNLMDGDTGDTGTSDEIGPPSNDYMREIMDQPAPEMAYDQLSFHIPDSQEIKGAAVNLAVNHATYVAFQPVYTKRNFLGCAGKYCAGAKCPGMYFEGTEWSKCWGEVFRIFRMRGPGRVVAGDVIAINYPRETGTWFGCAGKYCGKARCPGNPTSAHGMSSEEKWYQCWGEVFKIYARGKPLGAPIYAHDHIMLYYVNGKSWVGLVDRYPNKRTCPGSVRPPHRSRYECWGENFELWVR